MKYKVVHTEMYVPDKSTTIYNDISEFLKRYPINKDNYCKVSDLSIDVGESVNLQYDHYITLNITAIS